MSSTDELSQTRLRRLLENAEALMRGGEHLAALRLVTMIADEYECAVALSFGEDGYKLRVQALDAP